MPAKPNPEEIDIPKETLDKMFADIAVEMDLETLSDSDKNFATSLRNYYRDRGHLTPKQQYYFRKLYFKHFQEYPK